MPFFFPLLTGDPFGSDDLRTRVLLVDYPHEVTMALGGEPSRSFAIVDYRALVVGDFERDRIEHVADLEGATTTAILHNDVLIYLTAGVREEVPMVTALSVVSGQTLWIERLDDIPATLAVTPTTVLVPQPQTREVMRLDLQTGEHSTSWDVPCAPWGIAAQDETAWVSCPADGLLLKVHDGAVEAHDVPKGATDVLMARETPHVHVPVASAIVDPFDPEYRVGTPQALPRIATAPGVIAVEGVDRVTLLYPGVGLMRRNTLPSISSLAVTENGEVHYSRDQQWFLLLPE